MAHYRDNRGIYNQYEKFIQCTSSLIIVCHVFCVCHFLSTESNLHIFSVIVCPWLKAGLPTQCLQVVWCHWWEIELVLSRWLKTGWQIVVSQGKIPWNTPPLLGIEPRPRRGQTVSYNHSYTKVSWPHYWHINIALFLFLLCDQCPTCMLPLDTNDALIMVRNYGNVCTCSTIPELFT